jgi:serine/threonine-protein kinase
MITPSAGVVIAGRYTLGRLLGCGGMGSVWCARDRNLEIDVAVKFMDPTFVTSAEARTRFEREAKMVAGLSSQHVVQVRDYGSERGTPYIVMELLEGESLSARIAREDRFSLSIASRLLLQICTALRTTHAAGIVHRDLKPANIFLAVEDHDEVVKIVDFGIAKTSSHWGADHPTVTGAMLGSIHYMSPEQIRSSRQVDHRADLWSVGVILYRMLTGHLPFSGMSPGAMLVRACTEVCPPPSSSTPELSKEIDRFFARALALDPTHRFQSAMELHDAFAAAALEAPALPAARWENTVVLSPAADENAVTNAFPLLLAASPQASSLEVPDGLDPMSRERTPAPSWADVPTLLVPVSTSDQPTASPVEPASVAQDASPPLVFSHFSGRRTGTLAWRVIPAMVTLVALLGAVLYAWAMSARRPALQGVEPPDLPPAPPVVIDFPAASSTAGPTTSSDPNGFAPNPPSTPVTVQLPALVVTGWILQKKPLSLADKGSATPYDDPPADDPYP